MADVAATLDAWSTTVGSNSPSGSTVIGAGLDDNLRQIQAVVRLLASPNSITSATTTDLSAVSDTFITVSGTTTITGLGTLTSGVFKYLIFSGALTLTHNGTSLILPNASNILTVAGDVALMLSLGAGNWRCLGFFRDKQPTRQVLTTGTGATYTTPAGATRINVRMVGGGGGGAAATVNNGADGTASSFGTLSAGLGKGGVVAAGGQQAASAAANGDINIPGGVGDGGSSLAGAGGKGGHGADGPWGGAGSGAATGTAGGAAATNSGSGGGGGGSTATTSGGGGNAGAYCEKLITAPAATYTYTVGAKGTGGAAGTNAGGDGAAGIIIVDEYYS